jgi:hypothetical protein
MNLLSVIIYNGTYFYAYNDLSPWETNSLGPGFHKRVNPLIYEDLASLCAYNPFLLYAKNNHHHVHKYVFNTSLNIYCYDCIRYRLKMRLQLSDMTRFHTDVYMPTVYFVYLIY